MARPRVVIVRSAKVWRPDGGLDAGVLAKMYGRGLALLAGEGDENRAPAAFVQAGNRVGIKVNTLG